MKHLVDDTYFQWEPLGVQADSPLVEVPPEFQEILGRPEFPKRVHRRDGSQEECAAWFDVLSEVIGPSVTPGGVGMYCPVSRAAVHKRIKDGKLSIFLFHVKHRKTALFGQGKLQRESPYGYIPLSEVRYWREEIEQRALRQGAITQEELEGINPDWSGELLEWREKQNRIGIAGHLKASGATLPELLKDTLKEILKINKRGQLSLEATPNVQTKRKSHEGD